MNISAYSSSIFWVWIDSEIETERKNLTCVIQLSAAVSYPFRIWIYLQYHFFNSLWNSKNPPRISADSFMVYSLKINSQSEFLHLCVFSYSAFC